MVFAFRGGYTMGNPCLGGLYLGDDLKGAYHGFCHPQNREEEGVNQHLHLTPP